MENALDHSRRRLHLRPDPWTPIASWLVAVIYPPSSVPPWARADATSIPLQLSRRFRMFNVLTCCDGSYGLWRIRPPEECDVEAAAVVWGQGVAGSNPVIRLGYAAGHQGKTPIVSLRGGQPSGGGWGCGSLCLRASITAQNDCTTSTQGRQVHERKGVDKRAQSPTRSPLGGLVSVRILQSTALLAGNSVSICSHPAQTFLVRDYLDCVLARGQRVAWVLSQLRSGPDLNWFSSALSRRTTVE